jgi:hypothetical protein
VIKEMEERKVSGNVAEGGSKRPKRRGERRRLLSLISVTRLLRCFEVLNSRRFISTFFYHVHSSALSSFSPR